MAVCPGFLDDNMPGCDLAPNHGGPHYAGGYWWQERDDPPNWNPPNHAVMVEARDADRVLQFQVVIPGDGDCLYILGPPWDLTLTFKAMPVP